MNWTKLGLVYGPSGAALWARTHAWLPAAVRVGNDRFRVFIGTRDAENRSHIGYVDWTPEQPDRVLAASERPVLSPGPLGAFDDHGALPSCVVEDDGRLLLYYTGRNEGRERPLFYSAIGIAISEDGGETFARISAAPILGRDDHDPFLVASPCVIKEDRLWRMWYVSGLGWQEGPDGLHSRYHVRYAESCDGLSWSRQGEVAIELRDGETNIARPCVLQEDGVYRAWYPYDAGAGYRIGYAESADGVHFDRKDALAGIQPSVDGWDSEAMSYPWLVRADGHLYMFYNGNSFGRDGFGLAVSR